MIDIPGTEIPPQWPGLGKMAQQIYMAKRSSPFIYRYATADDLIFELQLREKITEAAAAMARSTAQFATFEQSRANPQYWIVTNQGGFLLRQGVAPSDAINDIFYQGQLYAYECAVAMVMVYYKGILDMIGPEQFNRLFNHLYLFSWELDSDLRLITEENALETFPGDILYFRNPEYNLNTPEFQGENVIKMGYNLYFGHGLGIASGQQIIHSLNRLRRPWAMISAYLMNQATYPDFVALRRLVQPETRDALQMSAAERYPGRIIAQIGSRLRIK